MKKDVVVIGAGVSGMSAALTLARHGRRVTLVERRHKVGPLLRRFRRGSSWCDGGFHYTGGFRPDGAMDVIFRYFGVRERLEPVALDPECYDRLIMPDERQVRIPNGMTQVGEALCEVFPKSAGAIDAYILDVERIRRATPFIYFDFQPDQIMNLRKGLPESLGAFLARAGAGEDLTRVLGTYGKVLYGADGEEVPFDFHALAVGSLYESAHMLKGGGDAIVHALEAGMRRQGVEIVCGRTAKKIRVSGHKVTGVELDGDELLECEDCIATLHPRLIGGMLDPGTAPGLCARIERTENSFGLFAIFLEVDEPPAALRGSNLYRIFSNEKILAMLSCSPLDEGEKLSFVALMPSHWDKTDGDGGYAQYKVRESERVLGAVLETLPELKGKYRVLETASPRTYEAVTGTVGGAAYGIRQTVKNRPLTALTGIEGFYLAGQSILVAGVLGAIISGVVAAAQIIDIKTIWNEVQRCR